MSSKVLVVDDARTNVTILRRMLERAGYDVCDAADGDEALEAVRRERPDLVLLDIMMPKKNGFEVCAELKADPQTSELPVIFLSSLDEAEDKIRGLELGAVDFLTKPVNRAETIARVRTHLRVRELTRFLVDINEELQRKQQSIEADLRAAAEIQRAMIPEEGTEIPGLRIAWRFEPCHTLGGDIFNIHLVAEDMVALYMLDVAGHGVPSSLVAISAGQALSPHGSLLVERDPRGAITGVRSPGQILTRLDASFPIERFDRHFTITLGALDLRTGAFRYSSAAHPPAFLQRRDGSLETLDAGGSVIGLGAFLPFDEDEVTLEPGDRLFLYTDGIPEHPDPNGDFFGLERFRAILEETRTVSIEEACSAVLTELTLHSGGCAPPDDISLLALELAPRREGGSR